MFDDEEVNNEVIFEENCEEELQVEQETISREREKKSIRKTTTHGSCSTYDFLGRR